jgi:hypothetical protein
MESTFENVLIESLDALAAGDQPEAILARYPEHQAELRPMLLTASRVAGARVAHSLEAQAASRQRFLDYAAAMPGTPRQGSSLHLFLRRLSLTMAALLVVLALTGAGILFASYEAVPGDALYEAKRFFEDARFGLTGDTAAREALQKSFEEMRVREIRTLLRMGRSQEVTFTGMIEAMEEDTWQVAGIEVVILDNTSIAGAEIPAVGDLVEISGLTANGRVHAGAIIIRKLGRMPEPTPGPESLQPTATKPSPTSTGTPAPAATQTPTPIEDITPTSTSMPTPESPESGKANGNESQGGSNSNENGGGRANENGGGNSNEDDDKERNGSNSNDDDYESNENGSDRSGNESGNDNENDNDDDDDDEEDGEEIGD